MAPYNITNKAFFKALATLPYVQRIILYGSRARGDFRDRSDLDLAIVAPKAKSQDWLHILDLLENADTLLHIDAVRFDALPDDSALKKAIEREGIVLYETH